jgi:hypothetical protein
VIFWGIHIIWITGSNVSSLIVREISPMWELMYGLIVLVWGCVGVLYGMSKRFLLEECVRYI